ncbi:MAG: MATE family efflux transporter [Sandaracinaceae bacterium]
MVRLAWPIAVSMLSYGVMTLVDTLFVGRLGASALAGVGLGGVFAFTVLCFGFGMLRGVKVLTSQAVGAGRSSTRAWLTGGVLLAVGLGFGAILVGQLVALFLPWMAGSVEAAENADTYLTVRLVAAPIATTFVAVREYRYGLGDTRAPMVAALLANLVNIALDAVFILGMELGVAGAAWSSVVAHAVELAVLVWLRRSSLRPARVSVAQLRELVRTGLPTGLQFWMEVGSFALLTTIIASFGDVELAAHQIALRVVNIVFLPCVAFGEAGSVMAGQAVGAGEMGLVKRVARYAMAGAGLYTAASTLVLLIGAPLIATAFTDEPLVVAATVQLLFAAALFQVADGGAVVARGVLRGTGDVRYPAVIGVATAWVATPPLAWLLGHQAGLGALGGWIGLSIEITAAAALFWWRLERDGWKPHAERTRLVAAA